jgi:hypothetical protein
MRALLLGLVLASCSGSAKPVVRGAVPELDYFVGRWRADATNPMTNQTFVLDYRIEPALRGRWYVGTGHANALDLEIHDVWGKLPGGEIVRTIFDSQGTFGTVRSTGWTGNVLVFEGSAQSAQQKVEVRERIERIGPDEFRATWEMKVGDAWQAYSVETLRRVK